MPTDTKRVPAPSEVDPDAATYEAPGLLRWLHWLVFLIALGLIVGFVAFGVQHPEACSWGRRLLQPYLDRAATLALAIGSIAMALAARAANHRQRLRLLVALAVTIAGGLAFLGMRASDYQSKWQHRLLAGSAYRPTRRYLETTLRRPLQKPAPAAVTATPPTPEPEVATGPPDAKQGQHNFLETCAACHGTTGKGVARQGADLVDSKFVKAQDDRQLLDFIKSGRQPGDPQSVMNLAMPAKGGNPSLGDNQLRNVVAYLRVLQKPSEGTTAESEGTTDATVAAPTQAFFMPKTLIPLPAVAPTGLAHLQNPKPRPVPVSPPEYPQDFFLWFFVTTGFYCAITGLGVGLAVWTGASALGPKGNMTVRGRAATTAAFGARSR